MISKGSQVYNSHSFFLDLPYPLVIANQQSFYVQFTMGRTGHITLQHDLKMWCHLIGLHARGVY